ncbi:HEPN domain-containing protein [Synechococcus lacustris]|nr:HEPN domain-containing protein [Synechococcus lacustris]
MAPAETSTGFLRIAHRDLRTAMAMADSSLFEESTWGFHLQQAIEKALKAWLLVLSPEQPPFSHNLRLLFLMLRDQDAAVEPFLGLSRFTLFAVVWRYDEDPELEHLNRTAWNQLCTELLAHVDELASYSQ